MKQLINENQYFKVNLIKFIFGIFLLSFLYGSIRHELQSRKFRTELLRQQDLNKQLERREQWLKGQNSDLEDRLDDLESRVDDLESNRNY